MKIKRKAKRVSLARSLEAARQEFESWPKWMKGLDRFEGSDYSGELDQARGRAASEFTGLLPCPFCGQDAELDTRRAYRALVDGRIGDAVAIYCTNEDGCPADMSICREDVPEATTEQLVEELTALWNRRVW